MSSSSFNPPGSKDDAAITSGDDIDRLSDSLRYLNDVTIDGYVTSTTGTRYSSIDYNGFKILAGKKSCGTFTGSKIVKIGFSPVFKTIGVPVITPYSSTDGVTCQLKSVTSSACEVRVFAPTAKTKISCTLFWQAVGI